MDPEPFSKQWEKMSEHVIQVLKDLDIKPMQKDAQLFYELWNELADEILEQSMGLLPQDMRTHQRRAITVDEFRALHHAASQTNQVHTKQTWEVYNAVEEMRRADYRQEPDPIISKALARWRHWKPNPKDSISTVTQRQIEVGLADKWLSRLLAHFAPFAKHIPSLEMYLQCKCPEKEWKDLFGDSRHNSLKGHCMTLEAMLRLEKNLIPWTESKINCLLNQLRDEEATPQKVQRFWNTLKYLSDVLGLLGPDSYQRLRAKKAAVKDDLVQTLLAPQRRANTPELSDIIELETLSTKPGPITDQYAAAIFRLMAGVSGRWNDICHTQISSMKVTSSTIEFTAWQTKTTGINDTSRPMPLIAPLHSFSGVQWWLVVQKFINMFLKDDNFKNMDYLLPVPTRDRSGFCPRPCSNGQALRWLRLLRARKDRDEQEIKKLTLASFRVWMADLAYQANISRDKRRYIGRWASENTADTYTREHRQVICSIWEEVTQKIHNLKGGRVVPEDLNHVNWNIKPNPAPSKQQGSATTSMGVEAVEPNIAPENVAPKRIRLLLPATAMAHSDTEDESEAVTLPSHPHCDTVGPPIGPLTVVSNNKATGKDRKHRIHLLNPCGQAIGCGWKPRADQTMAVAQADYEHDQNLALCNNCFKQYSLPLQWTTSAGISLEETDTDDSISASSDSDNSIDTASEEDAMKPCETKSTAATGADMLEDSFL